MSEPFDDLDSPLEVKECSPWGCLAMMAVIAISLGIMAGYYIAGHP